MDGLRRLLPRAGAWAEHLVRGKDPHLSTAGCRAEAGIDGRNLPADRAKEGECPKQRRMEHDAHPDGLAEAPGVDERRNHSRPQRRRRSGAETPSEAWIP